MVVKSVLVVDDESYVTTVVGQQLQRHGYDVVIGSDGQEALSLARERRPHLIVSDYQMPILSGLEMAVQLRQDLNTSAIPIIMLTARGHRVARAQLEQTNVRYLLSKPFSMKELLARVDELIAVEPPQGFSSPLRDVA